MFFTSKPNTSCTDAPFVRVLWYAWLMKYRSNTPNNAIRATKENQLSISSIFKDIQHSSIRNSSLRLYLLNALM